MNFHHGNKNAPKITCLTKFKGTHALNIPPGIKTGTIVLNNHRGERIRNRRDFYPQVPYTAKKKDKKKGKEPILNLIYTYWPTGRCYFKPNAYGKPTKKTKIMSEINHGGNDRMIASRYM